jgi:hypothetical protein
VLRLLVTANVVPSSRILILRSVRRLLVTANVPSSRILILRSVLRLLVTANILPSAPILVTLVMEALRSSEMSVLTGATRRYIPENGILHELSELITSKN